MEYNKTQLNNAKEPFERFSDADKYYMNLAILEANKGLKKGELPVGAVIVKEGKVIAKAHNKATLKKCALYHAEVLAIKKATKKIKDWRLNGTTLYVTLEPCLMCRGLIVNSRVDFVVFGAYDDTKTSYSKGESQLEYEGRNHRTKVLGGLFEEECSKLLKSFFSLKRKV